MIHPGSVLTMAKRSISQLCASSVLSWGFVNVFAVTDLDDVGARLPVSDRIFEMNLVSDARLNCFAPLVVLMLLILQICASSAMASELSGVVTLTSEYIYRGLEMSDGDPALQLGLDYEHDTGLFVGIWTSMIDLSTPMGEREIELDYYAGFHYTSQAPLTAMVTVLRYSYPGRIGTHSYDHNEVLFGATWRERYSIELAYTSNLYGLDRIGRHWELRTEWPVANAWVIGAALGGNDLADVGASRYLHWDIGASARFSRLTVDLRWYDNEKPDGFAAQVSANSQLVISVSAAF